MVSRALFARSEAIKTVGLTIFTSLGCSIANHLLIRCDNDEFFFMLQHPSLKTSNLHIHAIVSGMFSCQAWSVGAIAGAVLACSTRALPYRLGQPITTLQLFPYLAGGAAWALMAGYIKNRLDQQTETKFQASYFQLKTGISVFTIHAMVLSVATMVARKVFPLLLTPPAAIMKG